MRVMAALLGLCAACQQLADPTRECPQPCPASCPTNCLPTGYCTTTTLTIGDSPVIELGRAPPIFVLGDLPPSTQVTLSIDALLDPSARNGQIPWDYSITLSIDDADGGVTQIGAAAAFNAVHFPVEIDWTGTRETSPDGTLSEGLQATCAGRSGSTCWLVPGSSFEATVIDDTAWSRPPACN